MYRYNFLVRNVAVIIESIKNNLIALSGRMHTFILLIMFKLFNEIIIHFAQDIGITLLILKTNQISIM